MRREPPKSYRPHTREHRQMRELMKNLWMQCPPEREASFFDDFRHKYNLCPVYASQMMNEVKHGVAV